MLVSLYPGVLFPQPVPVQVYEPTVPSAQERVVCIAFDDGWKTHLEILPILKQHNFSATFPVVTSYVGYPAYMGWEDIAYLAQMGHDIVSHTHTHSNLSAVDEATLFRELVNSRQMLNLRGYAADVLIYPYGEASSNETVRDAVAQNYLLAGGTETGKCDLYSVDRYNVNTYCIYHNTTPEEFASYLEGTEGNKISLLYYHKISDESLDTAITMDTFQTQMQYLKDNGFIVRAISEQFLKQTG